MDCDYLMDLPFKESYKLNAYDGKTIKRHPRFRCLKEYIKIDRDKSTFKSHRDFDSEIEMTFKHF